MQTFTQTFASASSWELNVPGSYFTVLGCSNAVNVTLFKGGAKLSLGKISGLLAGLEVGPLDGGFEGYAFDRVLIEPTGADTVTVGIGNGQAHYNRAVGSVFVENLPAPLAEQADYTRAAIAAQDAGTAGTLFGANASRRVLILQNNDATKYLRVRVDGTAPTPSAGIRIAPGGYWEAPRPVPKGAIKVIAEAAGGIAVEGLEA